jgi:hypothetical protein
LLEHGANVNATDDHGRTPLHFAANFLDHDPMVKLLLENGANVNAADGRGLTPLHYACWKRAPLVARILLENGADVNAIIMNSSDFLVLRRSQVSSWVTQLVSAVLVLALGLLGLVLAIVFVLASPAT